MTESGKVLPYLQGAIFPTTKENLMDYVKENNAPEDIVLILSRMTKVEYLSISEVIRELEINGYL